MFAGAGYSIAHEANAPFTIKDGVIHTDKLTVQGNLFAMLGHGDLNFLKNNLDFDIRVDAGGPGAVLTPIYKLSKHHGKARLRNRFWRPKKVLTNFSIFGFRISIVLLAAARDGGLAARDKDCDQFVGFV